MFIAIDNPSSAHGSVEVEGSHESNVVKVTVHDPDCPSHEDTTVMSTYICTPSTELT